MGHEHINMYYLVAQGLFFLTLIFIQSGFDLYDHGISFPDFLVGNVVTLQLLDKLRMVGHRTHLDG